MAPKKNATGGTRESPFVHLLLAKNYDTMSQIRTMGALLGGVAAGVLGLTGFLGLLFMFVSATITSLAIQFVGCHGDVQQYFPKGTKELFSLEQMLAGAMTYILVWTVAYDAIYIF